MDILTEPELKIWLADRHTMLARMNGDNYYDLIIGLATKISYETNSRVPSLQMIERVLADIGFSVESRNCQARFTHHNVAKFKPKETEKPVAPSRRVVGDLAEQIIKEALPKLKTQTPRDMSKPIKTFGDLVELIQ